MIRFWSKVDRSGHGPGTCWIWRAAHSHNGYGRFQAGRRGEGVKAAHRVAFELARGPIPEGLVLDHLCRNPKCVNPDHLEPVTQRINVLRGTSPAARNARVEVCPRGHSNWRITSQGRRLCRDCRNAYKRRRRQELKK